MGNFIISAFGNVKFVQAADRQAEGGERQAPGQIREPFSRQEGGSEAQGRD
jgi:hypothetical protein